MQSIFTRARWLPVVVGGWLLVFLPSVTLSAELILVEQGGCYSCVKFNQEQGAVFDLWFAKELPLRRVDIHDRWPYKNAGVRRAMGTPTFILVEGGKEIGRFAGYGSSELFWKKFDAVMAKREGTAEAGVALTESGSTR
jgi:hypothetical protein